MSLANLENLSQEEHSSWAFFHQQQHEAIIAGIVRIGGRQLTSSELDPISLDIGAWSELHQSLHNDFCSVLRIAGSDFSGLDLQDHLGLRSWIALHIQEHRAANERLGIE